MKPTSGLCDDTALDAGTIAKPFCTTQRAIAALGPNKPVIVIRPGSVPIERWSYSAAAGIPELTVIGQDGATIGPASGIGITINSGNVYVRGLRVSGMLDAGVYVATGNATLRMNRCIVTQNRGGLFVNGAGFDIANSVFASNRLATIPNANGPAIEYGGVYLGGVPTGRRVFRNNTVYLNEGPGLVCGGAYPVTGVLVTGNTTSDVVTCNFDPLSSEVPGRAVVPAYDPLFDTRDAKNPYRLTSMSTCVNRGVATNDAPPDDIDGNARPIGGTSDCGAHEFGAAAPTP